MKYLLILLSLLVCCNTTRPRTSDEFQQTAVKIQSLHGSGGSGVIYRSSRKGTIILTNAHVCEAIMDGGFVGNVKPYRIQKYKISRIHDLCYLFIRQNLEVNTVIAKEAPEINSKAIISGHPSLYPHIISYGLVSGTFTADILIDHRSCTEVEKKENPISCIVEGMPILKKQEGQLISALISPGSSGSGVFNSAGELIGLAFASHGDLGYALIVPWKFLDKFVREESYKLPWESPEVNKRLQHYQNEGLMDLDNWKKIFNLIK
jgi:S1-C subfamily serine protease